jgi:superfamily II DNA or RNA helicase
MATGTGKTVTFSHVAKYAIEKNKKVLILAHRSELIEQAHRAIKTVCDVDAAIEKADDFAVHSDSMVTVASVQSLSIPERLEMFSQQHYGLIIIDECHHILAETYLRIIEHFDQAKVLGVTATPDRGDKRSLGEFFDCISYEYDIAQAINDGFLSKIQAHTIPLQISLNEVKMQAGDFASRGVDKAIAPYLEQIADHIMELAKDRKTVIYLPLIETSQRMNQIMIDKGMNSIEVNGKTKNRSEILSKFANNEYQVLCNSMLLTEGWDCPDVDCIVCLRPTKIRSLYTQIIGRGTRIATDKENLLILDFLFHSDKHSLCSAASLITDDTAVAEKVKAYTSGRSMSVDELIEQAQNEIDNERELALKRQLDIARKKKGKLCDPVLFADQIGDQSIMRYEPSTLKEMQPVAESQVKRIENNGLSIVGIDSAGHAEKVIDVLGDRSRKQLTSPKQIRQLKQRGFSDVPSWTFDQASDLITRIACNGWKTPYDINPKHYKPENKNEL